MLPDWTVIRRDAGAEATGMYSRRVQIDNMTFAAAPEVLHSPNPSKPNPYRALVTDKTKTYSPLQLMRDRSQPARFHGQGFNAILRQLNFTRIGRQLRLY